MKKALLLSLFVLLPFTVLAAGGNVHLDHIEIDHRNKASLQRGAQSFVNYCMGCHSAKHARYERMADDLEIPHDLMVENLIFGDEKIGSLMDISMPSKLSKKWFGATPPDLTLIARSRGSDWLYTYMRTFYVDPSRPWGVNNTVFKDVGMPHVLLGLQGEQHCRPPVAIAANGGIKRDVNGELLEDTSHGDCGRVVPGEVEGSMNTEEYQAAMYDLVNFMTYMAEPVAAKRERIGIYVLLFIAVFFVFTYLLNREYWKDVDH